MSEFNGVTVLVIGCGSRGEVYASYALKYPQRARIIGLAEPSLFTRQRFLKTHQKTIHQENIFTDWAEIVKLQSKIADCVLITLPDKLHKDAAVAFTKLGYHMLLEKPMGTLLDDCKQITFTCRENPSQINAVCHVLRYYPQCVKLKQLIDSGLIGDVVNINHTEPVGFEHFAHSFVRGNWHNESESSFSLLAKCCHDIDLLIYWMSGAKKKCTKVSSFGSLFHFRKENAPINSGENCFECPAEEQCVYSAKKIYKKSYKNVDSWPTKIVLQSEIQNVFDFNNETDIEDILMNKTQVEKEELLDKCLKDSKTKYGRCVYKMDNDVCDNQVVNLQFSDNSTATLTMIAFSKDICSRKTLIYGTKGQLEWDDEKDSKTISHYDFMSKKLSSIDSSDATPSFKIDVQNDGHDSNKDFIHLTGHGGSDFWLIHSFIQAVITNDKRFVLTDVEDSFNSHLIVFAAEYSRVHNKIVDIKQFCEQNDIQINLKN